MDKITIRQSFIDRRRFVMTTSALLASGLASTIGTLALGGAAYGVSQMGGGQKGSSELPALPAVPGAGGEATSAEKARIRRKTKTILTSPLTGGETFGTPAPTLLGSGDVTKKAVLG